MIGSRSSPEGGIGGLLFLACENNPNLQSSIPSILFERQLSNGVSRLGGGVHCRVQNTTVYFPPPSTYFSSLSLASSSPLAIFLALDISTSSRVRVQYDLHSF